MYYLKICIYVNSKYEDIDLVCFTYRFTVNYAKFIVMQLKIKFKLSGKRQKLPLNYQYPISAWIYKVINKADKEFAQMLHENGYVTGEGKRFKLFTFSKLNFPPKTWKIIPKSDRMQVWARNGYLTISFQLPEQTEKFVMGLFQEQKAFIGDKISGIEMEVESIEAEKIDIPETKTIKLKPLTSMVLGIDTEEGQNEQYVSPLHPEYKRVFLKNLLDKYEATGKNGVSIDDLYFAVTKLYPKTTMQTIKAFTPAETKVRGYNYEFELTAPKEVLEVGLASGFGAMCSLGFGLCGMVE